MCGNIARSQRVPLGPLCAERHLHNLCNSYQEFDTVLNSDICTTLIDVFFFFLFGLACGSLLVVERKKKKALFQVRINTRAVVCTRTLPGVTLVRGALASGYLEVSDDVVSACGSGFILFGLTGSCINFSDSFTVGEKSFCGLFFFLREQSFPKNVPFPGDDSCFRNWISLIPFPLVIMYFNIICNEAIISFRRIQARQKNIALFLYLT